MLRALQMRGTDRAKRVYEAGDRSFAIGFCNEQNSLSGGFQETNTSIQAIDGTLFPDMLDQRETHSVLSDPNLLFSSPGGFAFLGTTEGHLLAARDQLGQKPLYWGTDEGGNHAFASLIAPLKNVGIVEPTPVPPGRVIELSESGPRTSGDHALAKPKHIDIPEEDAVEKVASLLSKAVSLMVPDSSALAFSGGVDSALIATACKKVGLNPELITVAMKGQEELEHARRAADDIGLPITTKPLTENEVLEAATKVAHMVETKSPVTLGISLPFHFACSLTRELRRRCIVMGQLSDELFGGYARFEEIVKKEGLDAADAAMWKSVVAAPEGDFAPGDKVATWHGLEFRCPFAYLPLAMFALELPVGLRVRVSEGGVVRKYLLRRLAEKWGLPDYVVNRPKKAFQYSSGVHKVLARETRRAKREAGKLAVHNTKGNRGL